MKILLERASHLRALIAMDSGISHASGKKCEKFADSFQLAKNLAICQYFRPNEVVTLGFQNHVRTLEKIHANAQHPRLKQQIQTDLHLLVACNMDNRPIKDRMTTVKSLMSFIGGEFEGASHAIWYMLCRLFENYGPGLRSRRIISKQGNHKKIFIHNCMLLKTMAHCLKRRLPVDTSRVGLRASIIREAEKEESHRRMKRVNQDYSTKYSEENPEHVLLFDFDPHKMAAQLPRYYGDTTPLAMLVRTLEMMTVCSMRKIMLPLDALMFFHKLEGKHEHSIFCLMFCGRECDPPTKLGMKKLQTACRRRPINMSFLCSKCVGWQRNVDKQLLEPLNCACCTLHGKKISADGMSSSSSSRTGGGGGGGEVKRRRF